MFLRWKKRTAKGGAVRYGLKRGKEMAFRLPGDWEYSDGSPIPDVTIFDAVLVKSERIGGRPRQRFVCHLGTVRVDVDESEPLGVRRDFWRAVDEKLASLNLAKSDRARIVAAIEKRAPRLTSRERKIVEKMDRELEKMRSRP